MIAPGAEVELEIYAPGEPRPWHLSKKQEQDAFDRGVKAALEVGPSPKASRIIAAARAYVATLKKLQEGGEDMQRALGGIALQNLQALIAAVEDQHPNPAMCKAGTCLECNPGNY